MSASDDPAMPPAPAGLSLCRVTAGGEELALLSFPIAAGAELTIAELDLLKYILRGTSNAAIARARATSVKTVSNQVSALLAKCGASSRGDLAARWLELLSPAP